MQGSGHSTELKELIIDKTGASILYLDDPTQKTLVVRPRSYLF
ncbi:hypothetical protein SBF1_1290007 [Candidatus Desulfosporosinus infrequens]|uniref:Uncharacterized protein n=1 Tax=Candidatus Desulfosporosinus infrequens TaxID=2043169 RepID=A0A2U3K3T7_9FIRM|nr:hypothetical protein SBF1_1290007 [Candidatus Desulfosporosinus infrequens]